MKKILLASSALAAMTAAVYADGHEAGVTVAGDGRMGLVYDDAGDDEFSFSSRIRISFAASGQTDGGLAFGGSIRADNAGTTIPELTSVSDTNGDGIIQADEITTSEASSSGGAAGTAGSVFISGGFGKLSMGDVDGAARASVGHVDGVGYTSLADVNESSYIANAGSDPSALYEYNVGAFGLKASVGNPGDGDSAFALGASYDLGDYDFAIGYEDNGDDAYHVILGATAAFGDFTVKGIVGQSDVTGDDETQFALSGTYSANGYGITAFFTDDSDLGGLEAVGLGASYDLGGGASIKGGIASISADSDDDDLFEDDDQVIADLGLTFSF